MLVIKASVKTKKQLKRIFAKALNGTCVDHIYKKWTSLTSMDKHEGENYGKYTFCIFFFNDKQ